MGDLKDVEEWNRPGKQEETGAETFADWSESEILSIPCGRCARRRLNG